MPRDLADLAASLGRMPEALQQGQRRGVQRAALHVTTGIRQQISIATGGSNRLSGVGRRGARLSVGYDIKGSANPTALIKPRGKQGTFKLIEEDTKPHSIQPRARRGARALKLANSRYAARVRHPGTAGKHPFAKGVDKTKNDTVKIYEQEIWGAMTKAYM